jgi:hypothetical protein
MRVEVSESTGKAMEADGMKMCESADLYCIKTSFPGLNRGRRQHQRHFSLAMP